MATAQHQKRPRQKPLVVLLDKIVQFSGLLSVILLVIGVLGPLTLPALERPIHFEEKSLLPGSAHAQFRSLSSQTLPTINALSADLYRLLGKKRGNTSEWLAAKLSGLGLDVYASGDTTSVTKSSSSSSSSTHSTGSSHGQQGLAKACGCKNLHAVVPSMRGDGKEALVVVTPLPLSHPHTGSSSSPTRGSLTRAQRAAAQLALSAGAGLSLHLGRVQWLARDLVWVMPDSGCDAARCMQEWVDAYHGEAAAPLLASFPRAGLIQQALVLEVQDADFDTAEVLVHGHNGLLPKLDLYYLLRYFFHFHIPVQAGLWQEADAAGLHAAASKLAWDQASKTYLRKLITALHFAWQQAAGRPSGPHAAFKDVMVDAATVRLTRKTAAGLSHWDMPSRLNGIIESTELSLRSLNNMIERFHHSFFMYVLPSLDSFVSIERYIVPVAALIAVVALQAAASSAALSNAVGDVTIAGSASALREAGKGGAELGGDGDGALAMGSDAAATADAATCSWIQEDGACMQGTSHSPGALREEPGSKSNGISVLQHWYMGLAAVVGLHTGSLLLAGVMQQALCRVFPHAVGGPGLSPLLQQAANVWDQREGGLLLACSVYVLLVRQAAGLLMRLPFLLQPCISNISINGSSMGHQAKNACSSLDGQRLHAASGHACRLVCLALSAALLAGLSCLNWALAYLAALVIAFSALLPSTLIQTASSGTAPFRFLRKAVLQAVHLGVSAVAVPCLLGVPYSHWWAGTIQSSVCDSAELNWLVLSGLVLPCLALIA